MDTLDLAFFLSGEGTTLRAIVESIKLNILNINISCVVINKEIDDCLLLTEYCYKNDINLLHLPRYKEIESRVEFEARIFHEVMKYKSDLFMFVGWDFIVSSKFIVNSPPIINLHPGLPNTFKGNNAIEQALLSFNRGEITYTGSMVHRVIEEVDSGEVFNTIKVIILKNDTLKSLTERVKNYEKGMVITTLQSFVEKYNTKLSSNSINNIPYIGKVRTVKDIGYGYLLLTASDRLSSFDRYICNINGKGNVLNNMSRWWFEHTRHIIPNHYLYSSGSHMIVKKTRPIKLEFVVRGFMTGSTNTSIWPMYKSGKRNMYGIEFRNGYNKNEKLDEIIITPTTKGVSDTPIIEKDIVSQGFLTHDQYKFIEEKSIELFKYGQKLASDRGLILVDTKYEYGFLNDEIILIDELHTCDSSRYWKNDTYLSRFNENQEPEKMDKDCVRDFINNNCDPYNDDIPIIPQELITRVENVYNQYYTIFDNNTDNKSLFNITSDHNPSETCVMDLFFNNIKRFVVIIAGSISDEKHCKKIQNLLKDQDIYSVIYYCSAHKNTRGVLNILDNYEIENRQLCYVTVAGMSNALSGVVACNTKYPVIACPPHNDKIDMIVNINSTLQCPSNVPVMTILSPLNVAISIKKMFMVFI